MAGVLSGVKVLEFASIGPVPLAAMLLADMGAEIVRIDRAGPGGTGTLARLLAHDGVINRGRKSIALDMKRREGVEVALLLAEKSDILLEGFRPGVMDRLGVGPQPCLQRNPKLVYGRMTGWGQFGELSGSVGHDINYIAISGALHAIGTRSSRPIPPLNLVGDYGGGAMFIALGAICALLHARQTGEGQIVDAAMADGAATLMTPIYDWLNKGLFADEREANFIDGGAPFYGTYECSDGQYIAIGAIEPQFWSTLRERCQLHDEIFDDQWDVLTWPGQRECLTTLFLSRPRDEWCQLLEGSDACVSPVLSLSEAPHHPHNVARQTFVTLIDGVSPAPAPRFSKTSSSPSEKAPQTGEQSIEILRNAGLDPNAIRALLKAGVVHQAALMPVAPPA